MWGVIVLPRMATGLWSPEVESAITWAGGLLRLTMLLGKGSVGAVWRSLLLGFLVMTVGDVVYSFFAGFDLAVLDPLLDLLYTVAYALYARGTLLQLELMR